MAVSHDPHACMEMTTSHEPESTTEGHMAVGHWVTSRAACTQSGSRPERLTSLAPLSDDVAGDGDYPEDGLVHENEGALQDAPLCCRS